MKDHPSNPRSLSKKQYGVLRKSFEEFDYAELVAVNTDLTILAGHQRVHIMLDMGWGDKEIEVRMPSRKLIKREADEYLIRSNQNGGDWDFDILANEFDSNDLLAFGFEEKFLLDHFEVPKFEIAEAESQPDLTEKKKQKCPSCGHEF